MGLVADVESGATLVLLGFLAGVQCVLVLLDGVADLSHAKDIKRVTVESNSALRVIYSHIFPSLMTSVLVPTALFVIFVSTAHKCYRTRSDMTVASKASAGFLAVALPYYLLIVRSAEQVLASAVVLPDSMAFEAHAAAAAQGHRLLLVALVLLTTFSALDSGDGQHVKKMGKV